MHRKTKYRLQIAGAVLLVGLALYGCDRAMQPIGLDPEGWLTLRDQQNRYLVLKGHEPLPLFDEDRDPDEECQEGIAVTRCGRLAVKIRSKVNAHIAASPRWSAVWRGGKWHDIR